MPSLQLSSFGYCINGAENYKDIKVLGLACDSRRCGESYLFFCKGSSFKAEYAAMAVENGAAAVVCEAKHYGAVRSAVSDKPVLVCSDVMKCMAECAARFYGYPMKRLVSVAVTGTKGKTTTVHYINSILNSAKIRSATLCSHVPNGAPRLTTPEPIDFHAAAFAALKSGCTHIVCEISSQAQKAGRTHGVVFDIACFLNLGNDHISPCEHASMQEYFECKRSLFGFCRTAVVNISDVYGAMIYKSLPKSTERLSFSVHRGSADVYAKSIKADKNGCDFFAVSNGNGREAPIFIPSIGVHNAENALCAAAVANKLGIDDKSVFLGIAAGCPAGRGTVFTSRDKKITVIVDYAHNEMSFKAMFKLARTQFSGATVTAVFGCPGDKAQCRRRQLARLCAHNADKVIICEDDSGNEGYSKISAQIRSAFEDENKSLAVSFIEDRGKALDAAMENALHSQGKHLILMLGKGGERTNRTCGCDVSCITDEQLAENVIAEYDKKTVIGNALENSGKGEVICLEDDKYTGVAAEYFAKIKAEQIHSAFAVCDAKTAEKLKGECFACGVPVLMLDENEYFVSPEKAARKAQGACNMGFLPIFVSKKAKALAPSLAKTVKVSSVVYILGDGGILFGGKFSVNRLSLRRLTLINKAFPDERLLQVKRVLDLGIKNVSFVNGTDGMCSAVFYTK